MAKPIPTPIVDHPAVQTIDAAPDADRVVAVNDRPVVRALSTSPGDQ